MCDKFITTDVTEEKKKHTEIIAERRIKNDRRSFIFAFFGFCSAIIGIILYLIYEDIKPLRAKSLKTGIIVGIAVRLVLILVLIALTVILSTALSEALSTAFMP